MHYYRPNTATVCGSDPSGSACAASAYGGGSAAPAPSYSRQGAYNSTCSHHGRYVPHAVLRPNF